MEVVFFFGAAGDFFAAVAAVVFLGVEQAEALHLDAVVHVDVHGHDVTGRIKS